MELEVHTKAKGGAVGQRHVHHGQVQGGGLEVVGEQVILLLLMAVKCC